MNKKGRGLLFFMIFSLIFLSVLAGVVSAAGEEVVKFFQTPGIKQIVGLVFGIWNFDKLEDAFTVGDTSLVNSDSPRVSSLIVYIVIWFILFFAFSDILMFFSPFGNEYTSWVIGVGLTIIAANLNLIYAVVGWMLGIMVWIGVASLGVALIFSFIAFAAVSVGTLKMRKWAVRRKIAISKIRALQGRESAIEGLKTLKDLGVNVSKRS